MYLTTVAIKLLEHPSFDLSNIPLLKPKLARFNVHYDPH